jgi:hypothetical protein
METDRQTQERAKRPGEAGSLTATKTTGVASGRFGARCLGSERAQDTFKMSSDNSRSGRGSRGSELDGQRGGPGGKGKGGADEINGGSVEAGYVV